MERAKAQTWRWCLVSFVCRIQKYTHISSKFVFLVLLSKTTQISAYPLNRKFNEREIFRIVVLGSKNIDLTQLTRCYDSFACSEQWTFELFGTELIINLLLISCVCCSHESEPEVCIISMNPFVTKPPSINGKIDSRETVVFHNLLLHTPHHHHRHRLISFGTHIKLTPHTAVSVSWPFFWLNESRFNVQKFFYFSLTYFNSFRRRAHTFSRLVKSECIISHRRYTAIAFWNWLARAAGWVRVRR